ncbi:MAG: AraC family transcriptional regulator, partial [Thermonemataceae bacterium]|nr:AraC family transcriptional regulator [Thermonemataceae bacterium]
FALAPTLKLAVYKYSGISIKRPLRMFYIPFAIVLIDVILISLVFYLPKNHSAVSRINFILWVLNFGGVSVGFLIQNIYYLYKLFKVINLHEKNLGSFYSFQEGISLKWLKTLIYAYFFFILGSVITNIPEFDTFFLYAFEVMLFIFIIYIGIKAVHYQLVINTLVHIQTKETTSEAILEEEVAREVVIQKEISTIKIPNHTQDYDFVEEIVSDEKYKYLKDKLLSVMETKKPYLNPKLSIYDLADQVSTNYKYLSKLINQEFDMNFANFINLYRINEAKEKLLNDLNKNYKIEAIAELVGFNSKSAFNIAFKKLTGKTPSEFRADN